MDISLTATSSVSGIVGSLAYVILLGFTLANLRRGVTGRALALCSVLTLLYIGAVTVQSQSVFAHVSEVLFELGWVVFIARILRIDVSSETPHWQQYPPQIGKLLLLALALGTGGVITSILLDMPQLAHTSLALQAHAIIQILLSTLGLVLLEQVIRNGRELYQWRSRILNIALGVIFSYALFKHALELLLRSPALELTVVHGFVLALSVPLFIVGSLRNRNNTLRVNVSHQFAFRTGTLLISGLFLLTLGAFGYFARLFGDWFNAVFAVAAIAAVIGFAVLFGSGPLRRRLRVIVTKALFEYKYDYREEWLALSARLSERSEDLTVAQQGIESLLNVLGSYGGAIWRVGEDQRLLPVASLNVDWKEPLPPTVGEQVLKFLDRQPWVLDLDDLPEQARALERFRDQTGLQRARYLIPMYAGKRLFGLTVLDTPPKSTELNWEDYDLLKLVANQVAQILGLQLTDQALQESRQFQAVNQISAFVVHDLKTVSAQLSLTVHNAEKHRDNPRFVDDMVTTVANSVERMQHLLEQLRNADQSALTPTSLNQLLTELAPQFDHREPKPKWNLPELNVDLLTQPDRLRTAVSHLVNNAIQACDHDDDVQVTMRAVKEWVTIEIADTGPGMSARFIEERLFQPFDSTKGVSGMGVGAFQAREYLRGMGGDLQVDSVPGEGTTFIIRLAVGAAND